MSQRAALEKQYEEMERACAGNTSAFIRAVKAKRDELRVSSPYLYKEWSIIVSRRLGVQEAKRKADQDRGAVLFNGRGTT